MAGRRPLSGVHRERLPAPLRGFKLAHPVVSADGKEGGFSGVTLGRSRVYGVIASAACAQGVRHRSPSRWCDCGFYCLNTLDDARALGLHPDYRQAVIVEVAASGRFIRHERGLRYERQQITAVRVGGCPCGHQSTLFTVTGTRVAGWHRLAAACPACAGGRPAVLFGEFAGLLRGPPVAADDNPELGGPVQAGVPFPAAPPSGGTLDRPDRAALIPLLSAEVVLLQARLDELQRQLARLTASE